MNNRKRILFVVQHRWDRSPGQRYRCEQYIPYLEQNGFECVYAPLLVNAQEDRSFYAAGNYAGKLLIFLKTFWRRLVDVWRVKNFDIVFIYREAFMTGTLLFEKLMKHRGATIIYDFDDAIWKHDVSEANKALGWLKRPEKVNEIMQLSALVIAGNKYLQQHALAYNPNTIVFPSTINLSYYKTSGKKEPGKKPVVIGWSGSLTTIAHFVVILPVFEKLKKVYGNDIEFRVFGVPDYQHQELGIKGIAWTPQNEVEQIAAFDIGIMPLPDNEWTRGKCGMKGLQYMALEVATVMSAVGVNTEIITDGVNGLLAHTNEEWEQKLSLLIEDTSLRQRLGQAGKKTIEESYSCQTLAHRYVALFQNLA